MNALPTSFKDYPLERLLIDSIRSRLSVGENLARDLIMNMIVERQEPCSILEAGISLKRHNPEYDWEDIREGLIQKRVIVVNEDERVNFVYPVSALPTPHKVILADGRSFSAMCAVDALGTAFTFRQSTHIQSICAECGTAVIIDIENGLIKEKNQEDLHILHADLSCTDNWASSC